jgi:hypothetical protein
MKMKFSLVSFLIAALLSSCSSLVDPVPNSPAAVTKVEDYYLPLKNIGASYAYCRKNLTSIDTVFMTMQGKDATSVMFGNEQCYATDMTKTNNRPLFDYYFVMNDSEAYTLGKVSCFGADKYWLDLKAPLMVGQKWTFSNSNGNYYPTDVYTASVTRRGVKMKMPDGVVYDDVAEVIYTSKAGDSTVKWFAKGVGLIYSTSKKPDSDFGQEMRLVGLK